MVRRTWNLAAFAVLTMHRRDAVQMTKSVAHDIATEGGRGVAPIEKYKGDEAQFKLTVADDEICGVRMGKSANRSIANVASHVAMLSAQAARTRILQSHR